MICLSKADEGALRHLTYNQSPRPLAPEHTTRQDLNGISNLREHVAAGQDDDAGGGSSLASADPDEKWHHLGHALPPDPLSTPRDAGRWSCGPSSHRKAAGGDGQACLSSVTSPACTARLWGWVTWIASVLLVSFILTALTSESAGHDHRHGMAPKDEPVRNPLAPPDTSTQSYRFRSQDLGKRSTCTAGGVSSNKYNTALHVGALLIIWFVSTLACAFPILAKKFPGLRIPQRFFFVVRHFGTGVLIATAFVHLLPTAFISLGDPCLGDFWVKDYPAIPGAIALAAIFLVTVIEMVFHPSRRCSSASDIRAGFQRGEQAVDDGDGTTSSDETNNLPMRDMAPPRARTSSVGHGLNRLTVGEDEERTARPDRHPQAERKTDNDQAVVEPAQEPAPALSPELKIRKERLQCVLLELGILFHSIFIGMALSVSVGNEFIILLIAIVFHQTFEGLALGARISMVKWPTGNRQPWLMAMAYGFTTPLGQALGIATHTLYSPNSQVGLILVGVMNAISAGLLTFASLVELMSEDFLSDESWKYLRGRKRVVACVLVFLGAFCMSLVGAWA